MNRIELSDKEWVRIFAHLKKLQNIHIGLMPARLGWQTVQPIMKLERSKGGFGSKVHVIVLH